MSIKAGRQRRRQAGFTLIEMLVVAPMIILLIAAAIAAITSLTGQSIVLQTKNEMDYNLQNALDDIENDAIKATAFVSTSGVLPSPQGSDNNYAGTAAFTSDSALIMGILGSDKNPLDPTHQIIYYANQPNPCGSTQQANRTFITKVIYYVYNGSLWRRSIVPSNNTSLNDDYTVCTSPWQRNSCSPGYTNTTQCKTEDVEELKNVNSFNVQYYAAPDSTTTLPAASARQAKTVVVTINGVQTVAGQTVSVTGSTRATRLNDIDADLTAPASAPVVTYSLNATQAITFTWSPIQNATSYQVSYVQNGVTTTVGNIPGTAYTILTNRLDTITFNVAARNYQGTSPTTATSVTIPSVTPCQLQNSWVNYGGPYSDATFSKTSAGVVALSGLIKKSTAPTANEVICNLPVGYRPSARIIFAPATSGTTQGRVDIMPNGDVEYQVGSGSWLSLNGINFLASGATWTNLTGSNGWVVYNPATYAPPQVATSGGRVFIQGLTKSGTITPGTVAFTLPSSVGTPAGSDIYPARGPGASALQINAAKTISTRYTTQAGYWSLESMYYPTGVGTWKPVTFATTPTPVWGNYGGSYSAASYIKNADGLVSLKGLIKGGVTTSGTLVFTLPAGYRPGTRIICSQISYNTSTTDGFARLDVFPNGQVQVLEGTTTNYMSLAGCDFLAEQ